MDPTIIAALVESIMRASNAEDPIAARSQALNAVDLDAIERELTASAQAIISNDAATPDDLAAAERLTAAVEAVRAERAHRVEAAATEQAQREALQSRLATAAAAAVAPTPAPAPAPTATASVETPEPPAADPEPAPAADPEPEPAADPEPEPAPAPAEPATASSEARVPTVAEIAAASSDPATEIPVPGVSPVTAVAAMDIPGRRAGEAFQDLRDVAKAMMTRMASLGRVSSASVSLEQVPVAQFSYVDQLQMLGDNAEQNGLLLMRAGEPQALTASGGFCAPRENVYTFFGPINMVADLAQDYLPTVGAPRGGINYPVSPDIRDAFTANPSRAYTATNDANAVNKVVTSFTCPSFQTCDVEAQYVILKFGNFATRAYPEWVEHWIRLAMDVHAHKVSAKLIAAMVAASRASVGVGASAGATSTLFGNFDLAAADFRNDLKMRRDAPLECWVPNWIYDMIRSDLAHARKGGLETLAVTDAQITSWFQVRNLVPRLVSDWQDISSTKTTGAAVWPATLSFMIFAPGTFVKLDQGTLDLGVVRDSTLNTTNDYTMFVETFEQVCKVGNESRVYAVVVCPNGAFSADQNLDCNAHDIPGS